MDIPPNQTIYINNLNEKMKKEDLKKHLYTLFSQFGPVIDIVAMKTPKMRGQAFVVFREIPMATNALRSMQGFIFFDKAMRITFARSKSDVFAKNDGTYWTKGKAEKRKAEEARKRQLAAKQARRETVPVKETNGHTPAPPTPNESNGDKTDEIPTNNILFLSNLPDETTQMMLSMLFQEMPGFKDVRLVDGRADIGFVEFDTPPQAQVAKDQLDGFKITPEKAMVIKYAKQ